MSLYDADAATHGRLLCVEFSTEAEFHREYVSNIANGGIFIPSEEEFEVREHVQVELTLVYCGMQLLLEGEVVHHMPVELVPAGGHPGAAVHFSLSAADLRAKFQPLVGEGDLPSERDRQSGRRGAVRTPAHVQARVEPSGGGRSLSTSTRDLSAGGVLLSLDGEFDSHVGDTVQVSMTNPGSGEELSIDGTVVRELASDNGEVAAVGIEFDLEGEAAPELPEFVDGVRAAEHSRRLGGIAGAIAELGIENLLQMFGTCAPRGTLRLEHGVEEAVVVFEGGKLTSVRQGAKSGMEALARIVAWRDGSFEFQASVAPDFETDQQPRSIDGALLEVLAARDERARETRIQLDPHQVLRIADASLLASTDVTRTEQAVLELARVEMTVSKLLDIIPESHDIVLGAVEALIGAGILTAD